MTAPTASREHVECSAQSSATPISVLSRLGFISRRASVAAGVQGQTLGVVEREGPDDARERGAVRLEDVERAGVEVQPPHLHTSERLFLVVGLELVAHPLS